MNEYLNGQPQMMFHKKHDFGPQLEKFGKNTDFLG
jgi:hypothetical protein